ncbi:hypothetical protein GCM10023229_31880 [Flavisolibacter ginsenosidimutans]
MADRQAYHMNQNRPMVVVNPFSKAFHVKNLGGVMSDGKDGFMRLDVWKAGSGKEGAYVHLLKFDHKLSIVAEKETVLEGEGSENMLPVLIFNTPGSIHVVLAGGSKEANQYSIFYWEFSDADLAVKKAHVVLASLPFDKDKEYTLTSVRNQKAGTFGVTVLEEGGKKEAAFLHSLSFNSSPSLVFKQSTTLSFLGKKGRISGTQISESGTVFSLLSYPDEKIDELFVYSVLLAGKEGAKLLPLASGGQPLINCDFGLSSDNGILFSGLSWPGKKDYSAALAVGKISSSGDQSILKEEPFAPSLLDVLQKTKKTGLSKDYFVRSVTQRNNGVIDVVVQYCFQNIGNSASGGISGVVELLDAVIFSFEGDRLVSTIPIKRNLYQGTNGSAATVNPNHFGIPEVFTAENNLYLIYFDNPENTMGANDGKTPKSKNFYKGVVTLARIDKNYKTAQQQLLDFDHDEGFMNFYEMLVYKIDNKRYLLNSDKFGVFTKNVKTASLLAEVK